MGLNYQPYNPETTFDYGFLDYAVQKDYSHFRYTHRRIEPTETLELEDATLHASLKYFNAKDKWWIYEFPDTLVRFKLTGNDTGLDITVASPSEEIADERFSAILDKYPSSNIEDDEIEIATWTGVQSPTRRDHTIKICRWDDIRFNYNNDVIENIDYLFSPDFELDRSGRLILWSGKPGTGKTNAIRALAHAWRDWCTTHYIVDPERFFGGNADYLMQLLLAATNSDKWQLFILEDAGELLQADAKEMMGQGLSRFLNTLDGLLGQGLNNIFLVTTNEEIRKLHPAVTRAGRCYNETIFATLSDDEAAEWFDRHDILKEEYKDTWTLAELYAVKESFKHRHKEKQPIGFIR